MILLGIIMGGGFGIRGYAQERVPDVRYVPTPQEVVEEMLQIARVTSTDIVYDLGCGDGRIVITAAKRFGARGVGIDIDPVRIKESTENARKAGVSDRVKFLQQDLFQTDFRAATVVTLYLYSDLNLRLRPKLLRDLKPGTRLLSHEFDMDDWKPDNRGMVRNVDLYYDPNIPSKKDTNYYYWVIPADAAGMWRWSMPRAAGGQSYRLHLVQKFQEIWGEVTVKGEKASIAEARLNGDRLSFILREDANRPKAVLRFNGRLSGDTIQGDVEARGGSSAGRYRWSAKREL
ncbi:MAG: class I SAM-dependent methyltransferase [Deltaproteobacteria bacterium]|nr:class I SAM-dependent methyltransferase [Deltaproteobacteria bacterium]